MGEDCRVLAHIPFPKGGWSIGSQKNLGGAGCFFALIPLNTAPTRDIPSDWRGFPLGKGDPGSVVLTCHGHQFELAVFRPLKWNHHLPDGNWNQGEKTWHVSLASTSRLRSALLLR